MLGGIGCHTYLVQKARLLNLILFNWMPIMWITETFFLFSVTDATAMAYSNTETVCLADYIIVSYMQIIADVMIEPAIS